MIPDPPPQAYRLLLKPDLKVIRKDGQVYVAETIRTYETEPSGVFCLTHTSDPVDHGPLTDTDQAQRFISARLHWWRDLQLHISSTPAAPFLPFWFDGEVWP
jgi:hypothetical protein